MGHRMPLIIITGKNEPSVNCTASRSEVEALNTRVRTQARIKLYYDTYVEINRPKLMPANCKINIIAKT